MTFARTNTIPSAFESNSRRRLSILDTYTPHLCADTHGSTSTRVTACRLNLSRPRRTGRCRNVSLYSVWPFLQSRSGVFRWSKRVADSCIRAYEAKDSSKVRTFKKNQIWIDQLVVNQQLASVLKLYQMKWGSSSGVATGWNGGSGPPLLFRPLLQRNLVRTTPLFWGWRRHWGQVAPTQKFVWLGCLDVGSDDVHMEKLGVRSRSGGLNPRYPQQFEHWLAYMVNNGYDYWMYNILLK